MKKIIEKRKDGSRRVKLECVGATKTRASQQKETEINNIISKYDRTGILTHVTRTIPRFDDVSNITDYKSALDQVLEAQKKFSELPADLRSEFGNDPGKLIEFLSDSKNLEKAAKLGLVSQADTNMDGVVDAAEKAAQDQKDADAKAAAEASTQ